MRREYISTLVVGFAAGVLHAVPVIRSFACCLIIPAAAYFSLLLYQRSNNDYSFIDIRKGILFGLFTGLFAAFFGSFFEVFITLITKTNPIVAGFSDLMEMIDSFPVEPEVKEEVRNLFYSIKVQITDAGFSLFYSISILISNLFIDSIFGMLGGVIGAKILNNRNK